MFAILIGILFFILALYFYRAKVGLILGVIINRITLPLTIFAISVMTIIALMLTGAALNIPTLVGGGTIFAIMLGLVTYMFTGILPILSLIIGHTIILPQIKKFFFWTACSGALTMMLMRLNWFPGGIEATICGIIVMFVFYMGFSAFKIKSDTPYVVIMLLLLCLYGLTYIFPRNFEAISLQVSSRNKNFISNSWSGSNEREANSMTRVGFTKAYVHSIRDTNGNIMEEEHLAKGQVLQYFNFKEKLFISLNSQPFIKVLIPNKHGEYGDIVRLIPEKFINYNTGKNVFQEADGSYSVKITKEKKILNPKLVWEIISNTNKPFKIGGLPIEKKLFSISGGDYEFCFNNKKGTWRKLPVSEQREVKSSLWLSLEKGESIEMTFQ